jgi:hypothetical protein
LKVLTDSRRTLARVTRTDLWPDTHIRIGQTSDGGTVGYVNIEGTNVRFTVVGAGAGSTPLVRVLDADTNAPRYNLQPYNATFRGGERVAVGDVNGDAIPDVIVAPGTGMSPMVRVYDGVTGDPLAGVLGNLPAYLSNFTGGVWVASADVNGDGYDDVITGPDAGPMKPEVRVFSGKTGELLTSFLATRDSFRGGVRVAAGNVTGDGRAEIVTALGAGGAPQVRVFRGDTGTPVAGAMGAGVNAFASSFRGGVSLALGNVTGDRHYEIIVAPGAGLAPAVRVLDGTTGKGLASFKPLPASFRGGVRVGAVDVDGDGVFEVLVAAGPGGDPTVRLVNAMAGVQVAGVLGSFTGGAGVFVAGGRR